jgi:hypothetical protein
MTGAVDSPLEGAGLFCCGLVAVWVCHNRLETARVGVASAVRCFAVLGRAPG